MDYKGLTIQFDGDASKLLATMRKIDAEASATQTALGRISAAMKLDPTNQTLYQAQTRLLNNALRDETTNLTNLRNEYERYKKEEPAKQAKNLAEQEKNAAAAIQERQRVLESEYGRSAKYLTEYQQNAEALRLIGDHADTSTTRVSWLRKETDKYTSELDRLRRQYQDTLAGGGEYGEHLTQLSDEIAIAEAKVKGYKEELEATSRLAFYNTNPFGKFIKGSEEFGQSLVRLGGYLTNVIGLRLTMIEGALALGFGNSVITEVENYTNAISQVGGYLDITGQKLEDMSELALYWGKETQFSATEAADAMSELAKGGMTDAQIAGGALEATMQLAAAGGISMADAATVAVNAIKVFGLSAEDATDVADALAGAANKSTAEIGDLASSFRYVSGWAGLADYSINDVSGALGLLADYGLTGQIAGTGLRNVLQRLAAPTGKAASLMEEYGLQVYNADGKMKGIVEIVGDLNTAFSDLDDETRNGVLNTIFGARGLPAAVALMEAGTDQLREYIAATEREGYALEMMNARMGDIGWALEYLRGEFETFKVNIGKAFEPYIIEVANAIEDLLADFNSWDPSRQREFVSNILKVAAVGPAMLALGTALKVVGTGVITISRLAGGIAEFSMAIGRAESIVSALGAGISAMSGGMLAAEGAVFGLVAGIGILAAALAGISYVKYRYEQKKAQERTEKLDTATRGLVETIDDIKTGDAIGELQLYGDVAQTTARDFETLLDQQAELAETISGRNAEAQTQIEEFERAKRIIEEYGDKTGLTAQELGALQWALELVNGEFDANFQYNSELGQIYDDQGRSIQDLILDIDELIAAREREIKAEAIQNNMRDLYQAQSQLQADRTKAEDDYNAAFERELELLEAVNNARAAYNESPSASTARALNDASREWQEAHDNTERLRQNLADIDEMIASNEESLRGFEEQLAEVMKLPNDEALKQWFTWLSNGSDEVSQQIRDLAAKFGDDLPKALNDAGLAAEDFALLTRDEFVEILANSASVDEVADKVARLAEEKRKAAETENPEVEVTETGTDKVVAKVKDAKAQVDKLATSKANVVITGTATSLVNAVNAAKAKLDTLPKSKTVTIDAFVKGGKLRDGGIHAYADGYITNHSMYSGNRLIGEAGIEAVLPLNNRAATRPLTDTIADGVARRVAGATQYNLYINDARVNDDPAIRSAFLNLMGAVNRKGMMVNAAR